MRAGAGYVTAFVPASLNLDLRVAAARGDDGAAARRRRRARLRRRRTRCSSAPSACRRARARAGARARADGAPTLARGSRASAELPLLLDADGLNAHAGALESLAARSAPTVLTPHAGELGRLLGLDSARRSRRAGFARCARRGDARPARSSCSRATTRSSRDPDGRVGVSRGRRAGARHGGHRRRPLGRDRGVSREAHGPVPGRLRRGAVHAERRAPRGAAIGAEGVIASDVIEALPRALHAIEALSLTMARAGAGPRQPRGDRAQRRRGCGGARRRRRSCARSSRPTATGTARVQAARAALAGGASLARGRDRAGGGSSSARRDRGPVLVMGALSAEELPVALAARRRRGRLERAVRRRRAVGAGARGRRARQARHRDGAARNARRATRRCAVAERDRRRRRRSSSSAR